MIFDENNILKGNAPAKYSFYAKVSETGETNFEVTGDFMER
jgi:hypothetical protein